jgi:YegS/Rv2252/BmrU family lipid kinase
MKILVICNPISGGGRARRLGRQLGDLLEGRGHRVELYVTGQAGDGRRRAATAEPDLERIVVVGGDGTLNEVLNGLRDPSRIPLAQLGTGTANLLAHELDLPSRPADLAGLVENGPTRRVDMGLADGRRFLLVVSAGFDGMVTRVAQGGRSGTMSYFRWLLPILKVLKSYRPPRLAVRVDGGEPTEGGLVIVSNVRNYGGIFTAADRARCDSGHLDVCILVRASVPRLVRGVLSAFRGGLSRNPDVIYRTGTHIEVRSDQPVETQIDGDPFGTTPLDISVVARHVPVVVPSNASRS